MNVSTVRTLTFTKAMDSLFFTLTESLPSDDMPTKALVNVQGAFPAGSTLTVEICNNGNDDAPTWEDVTTKALTNQKCYFANATKTADAWGVKVRVSLLRGSATGACFVQSVGGNFQ
jgi:hypothetical protein